MRVLVVGDFRNTGPGRFAKALWWSLKKFVEVERVDLGREGKLRALKYFKNYDIINLVGFAWPDHVLASWHPRLVLSVRGIAKLEARLEFKYPKKLLFTEWITLKRAKRVVYHSELLRRMFVREYGASTEHWRKVPGALSPDFIEIAEPKGARELLGFQGSYILWVGNFRRIKGARECLRIFSLLKGRNRGLHLVMLGVADGPPAEGVHWLPKLDTEAYKRVLAGAAAYINTSLYESFSLTSLEAASQGVPPLVSRFAGASEWLAKEFPKLVIDPRKPEEAAEKIEAALANPPAPERLISWARGFTGEPLAKAYLRVYEEIL